MYKKLAKSNIIYSNNLKVLNLFYKILGYFVGEYHDLAKEIKDKKIYIQTLSIKKIRELKKMYFNIDNFTDTITLIYDDSVFIFICLNVIYNNSRKYKVSYEEELLRVLIHSLLHSCGFCESNEILILQEEFLKKLKNKDTL
jgi:rRNA maturation RNase YbeY